MLEEEAEALVLADPRRELPLALLPGLLQLGLELPQHVQLLVQPGLARPGHLQVQFQVQRSPQEAVQTLDGHRRLTHGKGQTVISQFSHICHLKLFLRKKLEQRLAERRPQLGRREAERWQIHMKHSDRR